MKTSKILSLMLAMIMVVAVALPSTAVASTGNSISSSDSTSATLKTFTAGTGNYQALLTQKESNYTGVTVQFPNHTALALSGITKVKVDATMTYDGNVTQQTSVTKVISLLRNYSFTMDFPNYGNFTTKITYYKGTTVAKTVTTRVDVVADEYNIAPLVATFPVLYFTLQLQNINTNTNGDPIPTFVSLQRPKAYNWDQLPENVYWQPNLTKSQVETQTSFENKVAKFKDYVKSLYAANPNAKFHLYINDAYEKYILQLMCANGIPEANYDVLLLSDGAGSYGGYNRTFNVADPQAKYNEMAAGWAAAKAYAYEHKTYTLDSSVVPYYGSSNYAVVVANEDANATWWVARKSDTFVADTGTFRSTYIINSSKVVAQNITNMLNALTDTEKATFKTLYNFNDQMFAQAEKEGKKVMMILGSRVNTEPTWGTFSAYAKFLMMQYGDDYVYYYKGHPATPTDLYPEKQAELAALGITDVESSIPAEVILFFYPDLYMAGYTSSTYASVSKNEMATGLFGLNKTEALGDGTGVLAALVKADAFNFYMDGPYSNTPAAVGTGIPIDISGYPGCVQSHENYIINFSDAYLASQGNIYDVAVCDYTDNMVYYFKQQEDSSYTLAKVALGTVTGLSSKVSMKNMTTTVSWNAIALASSYQIQYKTKYSADWKTTTATTNSKVFPMIKGQTFEYRVRPCIEISGTKYYGDWSDTTYRLANSTTLKTSLSISKMTLTGAWSKVTATGKTVSYEVALTNNGTTTTYKTSNISKAFKSLVSGHTYAMKVRPLATVAGKTYIGAYSNVSYRYAAGTSITKLVSLKSGVATLTAKKFSNATGYDIVYSTSNAFTASKHLKVKGASNVTTQITGLTSKDTTYFKVRAYKIIDGVTYYGAYSSVQSVLVK